jgi:acid stress-induced BolA-like protein IbaG/YrbA
VDKELIKAVILDEISDAKCFFEGDECNLKLLVISSAFDGCSILQQHKMVLAPLKKEFESGALHALSIETRNQ